MLNVVCTFYIKKKLMQKWVGGSVSTQESGVELPQLQSHPGLNSEFQASLALKYETWCQREE